MSSEFQLPPGQQLASAGKWPQVGERAPAELPDTWTLAVEGLVARPRLFSLAELQSLPLQRRAIDIHCVTRWSKPAVAFGGVLLADVLAECLPLPAAAFVSFTAHSARRHDTSLPLADALQLGTLIVWEVEDRPLALEHGGPLRTVVPDRYFYKSLKWLRTIRLLERDELGYWEREAGYHNTADPWREQRYMAPTLTRLEMREALRSRRFAERELRSIDCRGHDLTGLDARGAILRDADFRDCPLGGSNFAGANLSNGRFQGASAAWSSFRGADVEGANFAGADLRNCDFREASLFGATFRPELPAKPTRLDRSTLFDAEQLAALMPEEEAFVRDAIE